MRIACRLERLSPFLPEKHTIYRTCATHHVRKGKRMKARKRERAHAQTVGMHAEHACRLARIHECMHERTHGCMNARTAHMKTRTHA